MRKTFLKVSILAALGLAMSASFTSCKDYDSEINDLQGQVDALKQSISTLEGKINAGAVITSVSPIDNGYRFTLSDGKTYDITNGKNGENGKDGESNLWTIVEDANGKLVWALNGVATEYPAQGPAGENGKPGENGESLPGIYYKPGEDGKWIKVNPDGTEEPTDIAWKPAATESLYAVADNDKVVIYNLTDENGKDVDPVTIWKSSFIKSLVVKPELYLDGIEAARYGVAVKTRALATKSYGSNTRVDNPNNQTGTVAYIVKGQPAYTEGAVANGQAVYYQATEKATITYGANPSNAVLGNMKWNLVFDDIEVASRASKVAGEVKEAPTAVDENGNITLAYQLTNDAAYNRLKPNSTWMTNADGDLVDENGNLLGEGDAPVYTGSEAQWTFMAMQGANMQTDSTLVVSDNVALLKQWIWFKNLIVKDNSNFNPQVSVAKTAADAIKDSENANPDVVIPAPYNKVLDLASYIAIQVDKLTPMLGKVQDQPGSQDNTDATGKTENAVMSLADAKAKWGLTPTFTLVDYTVGELQTSESQFAKIDGSKVTPQWVGTDGAQHDATTGEGGRSAIDRRPLVYVTLNDATGKIVLAGFVKIEWTQPETVKNAIVLKDIKVPYICNFEDGTNWEQVSGGIYEQLGYTAAQFSENFEMLPGVWVENNGQYINVINNKDYYNGTANYGEFTWFGDKNESQNPDGSHTQGLFFSVDQNDYAAWYPQINPANGKYWTNVAFITSEAVGPKTLYAKFYSDALRETVYIGFNVTVVGAPAANYDGKLFSAWSQNYTVTPVNPAVPGQTKANVYGENSYAQVMGMNFTSAWKGGDPAVKGSNAAYVWVSDYTNKGAYTVGNITAEYSFATTQPEYTGVSNTKYAFYPAKAYNPNAVEDYALYAYPKDKDGNVVKSNYQPIAVINANNAINQELFGNADIFGSTAAKSGVFNRIDFLSVYAYNTNGDVLSPAASSVADTEWIYGKFACDVINSQAYNFENPAITFNVEMTVTYSQNPGNVCKLVIPETFGFKVGAGRPITMTDEKSASIQDAVSVGVLASKLFQVTDWQGHKLWNVNTKGAVTKAEFNGATLGDFWMSLDKYNAVKWGYMYNSENKAYDIKSKSCFTIDLKNAVAYNGEEKLGIFSQVYTDKQLTFTVADNAEVELKAGKLIAEINNWTSLDDLTINWTNDGNSVTSNITVKIPVYVSYIWGQNIYLGDAVLTITPTLQGKN